MFVENRSIRKIAGEEHVKSLWFRRTSAEKATTQISQANLQEPFVLREKLRGLDRRGPSHIPPAPVAAIGSLPAWVRHNAFLVQA